MSLDPRYGTSDPPVDTGLEADAAGAAAAPDEASASSGAHRSRTGRAVRAVGVHAAAIVLFSLPAVALWWHVWSGHPSATLTCGCGDPAQEVWFMAWPAWAMTHLHDLFFSGAVNVPHGANLLSNTSGTLVGVVLAPVTWLFGPVTATNVALTLAPALSAWGCFAAVRPLVAWKPGAIPAGLVYGYSAAIVTSLAFGHVSVTLLVIPPLLFTTLHEIVIRQEHSVRRDALVLAALLVVQFLISPEVLVMCLLLGVVGMAAVTVVGWRQVRVRAGHALPALGLAAGVTIVLLAYPAWFGVAGPQAVTGLLFPLAPVLGVPLSGLLSPGQYGAFANEYVRFGGYLGRNGPPADYVGGGAALAALAAAAAGRRRPLTWLLVFMTAVTLWLALGAYLEQAPGWLGHPWLPWSELWRWPVLKEILPDQMAPLMTLFIAFLLAVGLDALYVAYRRPTSWLARHLRAGHRGGHRSGGRGGARAGLRDLRSALHGRAARDPHLHAPGRAGTAAELGAAHRPLRRLGLPPAHAVAGGRRLPLPAGRRRAQDTQRPGRPGGRRSAGVGPADHDEPDRARGAGAHRDAGADRGGPPRPGGVAGRRRRDQRPQPRPRLRLGVLHHGAGHGAGVRGRGLGVAAATGETAGRRGDGRLPVRGAGRRRRHRRPATTRPSCPAACSSVPGGHEPAP